MSYDTEKSIYRRHVSVTNSHIGAGYHLSGPIWK